MLYYKMLSRT